MGELALDSAAGAGERWGFGARRCRDELGLGKVGSSGLIQWGFCGARVFRGVRIRVRAWGRGLDELLGFQKG